MDKGLLISLAMVASLLGMAWIALSMEAHWSQVRGSARLGAAAAIALRMLGALSLLASLLLCLRADHASMAVLVWIMAIGVSAGAVAFVLAWKPRLMRPMVAWVASRS